MKFILALAPLASLSVLANSPTTKGPLAYARPSKPTNSIKFTEDGIHNVLKASSKNGKDETKAAGKSIKDFFDRNPSIVKSIMKVANEPKYKAVRQDAMNKAMSLYSTSGGDLDFYNTGIKVTNYVYSHPKFLEMLQEAGAKVLDEHPGAVDQFFSTFDKLVKKNPSLIHKIKKEAIQFSKDNEETYYKTFEMVVKSFTIRPRVAARAAIRALEADQIACPGNGSTDCACNKEIYPEVETEEPTTEEPEVEEPEVEESSTTEEPEVGAETPEIEPEVEAETPEIESEVPETELPEVTYARPQ